MLLAGSGVLAVAAFAELGSPRQLTIRNGGTFRITVWGTNGMDLDPALPSAQLAPLVEATCARLMTYPDATPPPKGFRLKPEVAVEDPKVSPDGKRFTFVLRSGRRAFRFSNGARVQANAFERQIVRLLELKTYGAELIQDIVGADRVENGRVRGIVARGNRLTIKLRRPVPDLPARLAAPWFCAVPPTLQADPEGVTEFDAAGPYYVKDNVRGRRIVLRRNRFYRGSRPHHVDGFVVDGQAASLDAVIDRVDQGVADWGWAPPGLYFRPERRLVARFGVNKSRFFLQRGLVFNHYNLNTSRELFRDNARLRRAVNFAINRRAVQAAGTGRFGGGLTDQYLPAGLPGFRDEHIYPLKHSNFRMARKLAKGHTRSGKAILYTPDLPSFVAAAQVIKQNLARIGLVVEFKKFPSVPIYLAHMRNEAEPWDIGWSSWGPDYLDPSTYLNSLLDGQFTNTNNWPHFDSRAYNRLLRRAAQLRGEARYREYARLDAKLAREAAPMVAISFSKEPTFVSKRVDPRCIVLRPELDLTAVCLK